ncbi:hypothetical protein [Clavibacter michiganensis]|nr:hypothetical protein [Clavibacter michiganensis]
MIYELAHRPRTESNTELVTLDASSSWAAVEQLGQGIPKEHVIFYVRRLD